MNNKPARALLLIRIVHTTIWIFFNGVLFYLAYAVISGRIDKWVWVGLGLFALEGVVLLIFSNMCPLTIMARKYSDSNKDNFDIILPNWLAKNNKRIYGILLAAVIIVLIFRLAKG